MFSYYEGVAINYTILIAAILGLIRFKKIDSIYRPFIYYTWINAINQTLNVILSEVIHSNTVNANIYVLFEAILFTWLFYNLGSIARKRNFIIVIIGLVVCWIYDNLIWHDLTTVNSFFRVTYSFILIFLSIGHLNKLIVTVKKNLFRNAGFLISMAVVIYYSYKATIEVFYMIRLKASSSFYGNIWSIMLLVTLFVYFVYAIAALWIPRKQKFTLQ